MASPHQQVSPVSAAAQSPQAHHRLDGSDRDANAPEAVDAAATPSTFVASPDTDDSHPRTTGSHAADDEGAKEVFAYDKSDKIAVPAAYEYQHSPYPQVVGGGGGGQQRDADAERDVGGGSAAASGKGPQQTILRLKRRTFFTVLVIACVIVAVAVGGGVGGALGSRKSNTSGGTPETGATASGTSPAATPTTPAPSSTTGSGATSSAPSARPTFLNQTDTASGHFFQGFAQPGMAGAHTDVVAEVGGADFAFDVRSYQFVARNTNCCLSFCRNATSAGWLGYLCESRRQNDAADAFSRVFVWCSDKRTDAIARGRCA